MRRRTARFEVSKRSLFGVAAMNALTLYRRAFTTGRLGGVHYEVVQEAYRLAADELFSRAKTAKYRARRMLALMMACLCAWGFVSYVLDQGQSVGSGLLFGGVLTAGAVMLEQYASSGAYRSAARLLDSPKRPELPSLAETTPL